MIATTRVHIRVLEVGFHLSDCWTRCGHPVWPGYRFKNFSRAASSAASAAVRAQTPSFPSEFDIPHPKFCIFLKNLHIRERESRADNAKVNFARQLKILQDWMPSCGAQRSVIRQSGTAARSQRQCIRWTRSKCIARTTGAPMAVKSSGITSSKKNSEITLSIKPPRISRRMRSPPSRVLRALPLLAYRARRWEIQ